MALNWIKWVKGVSRRREIIAISADLSLDRRVIACCCFEFWEWADDNTTTGKLSGVCPAFIDDLVSLPGFARAMEKVKWLMISEDGISIPRFKRHNGDSAKNRAKDAERKAKERAKGVLKKTGQKPDTVRTRQDKTRRDKSKVCPSVVRDSSEGVEGEGKNGEAWELHFECLDRVKSADLAIDSMLCGFHRHAHAERPSDIGSDLNSLVRIFSIAEQARRPGAARTPRALFAFLLSNPSSARIDPDAVASAKARIRAHQEKIKVLRANGEDVPVGVVPLCDADKNESTQILEDPR